VGWSRGGRGGGGGDGARGGRRGGRLGALPPLRHHRGADLRDRPLRRGGGAALRGARGPRAEGEAVAARALSVLAAPGFHHLHLNSVDPERAIDFYVRQFPRSRKMAWGGRPALAAPNDVLVLFERVGAPPVTTPQRPFWHFPWPVTHP